MSAMPNPRPYHRPVFEDALKEWKARLQEKRFSTDLVWILDENLCYERDPEALSNTRLGFQTKFTPQPADSAKVTYHHFAETDARLVFYRLGASGGKSVCLLLCDPWFESKGDKEGYVRRDDWKISFYPGEAEEIEEISDEQR